MLLDKVTTRLLTSIHDLSAAELHSMVRGDAALMLPAAALLCCLQIIACGALIWRLDRDTGHLFRAAVLTIGGTGRGTGHTMLRSGAIWSARLHAHVCSCALAELSSLNNACRHCSSGRRSWVETSATSRRKSLQRPSKSWGIPIWRQKRLRDHRVEQLPVSLSRRAHPLGSLSTMCKVMQQPYHVHLLGQTCCFI